MQAIGLVGGLGPGKLTKTVTKSASLRHLSGGECTGSTNAGSLRGGFQAS